MDWTGLIFLLIGLIITLFAIYLAHLRWSMQEQHRHEEAMVAQRTITPPAAQPLESYTEYESGYHSQQMQQYYDGPSQEK